MFFKIKQKFLNSKGFSLIEVATAIVILGFVATLAMPTYKRAKSKAYRAECSTMLSELNSLQNSYINNNNGKSYNAIHCPKTSGTHTRLIGTVTKNVLVLSSNSAKDFCDPGLTKIGPNCIDGATTYDGTTSANTLYAYAFQACAADELHSSCPGNIEMIDQEFPDLTGNNFRGYAHPTVDLTTLSWTDVPPLVWPNKAHHFLVKCEGNIDDDAFSDILVMDNIGTVFLSQDDLINASYP